MKHRLLINLLLALSVPAVSCVKRTNSPGIPSSGNASASFKQGETLFESGKFEEAARAYENVLRDNPSPAHHDRVLYRLASSYAMPGHGSHDRARSIALFKRLLTLYPESRLKSEAELILRLQQDTAESEKLKAVVKERDDRIRVLREELDKLKKIDLERRPSRPPQ